MSGPVAPPPATGGVTAATGTGPLVSNATVLEIPDDFPPLENGALLSARVVARPKAGEIVVETPQGPLTLGTAVDTRIGDRIALLVVGTSPRLQVAISAAEASGTSPGRSESSGASSFVSSRGDITTLTTGTVVSATVTGAATTFDVPPGAAHTREAMSADSPPSRISASFAGGAALSPSKATGSTGSSPSPPAGPPSAKAADAGVPTAAPENGSPALTKGTAVSLRIVSLFLPGAARTSTTSAGEGGETRTFLATVVGRDGGGRPVVQTEIGELTLATHDALPRGTQLVLALVGRPRSPDAESASASLLGPRWETLARAIETLRQADPAAARTFLAQTMPQPGARLTPGLLFFIAAVLNGDLRRWLGEDATRSLERNANRVLERLKDDFREMRRMATDAGGQEWRTFLIPVASSQGLEQVRVFIRDDRGDPEEEDEANDPGTRFVIEVDFSRLGPFQFDGLTRQRRIDLVVRTRSALPAEMRREITRIYTDIVSALGFGGTIAFQVAASFDLAPLTQVAMDTSREVTA